MSDNFIDPILSQDFDTNSVAPDVDYSKMLFSAIGVENTPSVGRIAYNKAKDEGATQEQAKIAGEEANAAAKEPVEEE